jgi:hypothetical protein
VCCTNFFDRLEADSGQTSTLDRTGKIFNVLGDVFPSNLLEQMLRDMYARNQTERGNPRPHR